MAVNQCAWEDCEALAAYGTLTKPAWCDEHISELLRQGGLEPLEPFTAPGDWRLTRCLTCGCEAHYRFVYTLDKNADQELTCRACFWAKSTADTLRLGVVPVGADLVGDDQARAIAGSHGYEYLGPSPLAPSYRVRCRYCGRISAERIADIDFGCSCQLNRPRANMTKPKAAMLRESQAARLWWDFDKNAPELWTAATERTMRSASWKCPECGLHFEARIRDMYGTPECPDCGARDRERRRAECELARVTPISGVPELVARWADEESPDVAMLGGLRLRRFLCEYGHYARVSPHSYLTSGCPSCRGQATRQANIERDSAMTDAERAAELQANEPASLWHPTRNAPRTFGDLRGRHAVWGPAWWLAPECGHEWEAPPSDFALPQRLRCLKCRSILDSLAWHFPDLAAEWSPDNPLNAWHVRPSGSLTFIPEWICSTDPAHRWRIAATVRVHGSTCPLCRESGKSIVELRYFDALRSAFGEAFSGLAMRSEAFARRSVWVPDVTVQLEGGRTLLIEYDGSYWHAGKVDIDLEKSRDLLAAGALVVRLREYPLPSLGLDSRDYLELPVSPTATDLDATVLAIREWLDTRP